MVEYLKDKPLIVYAHNGGKFDFFFMADFFEVQQSMTVINGRITKFKIGDCEFRDSYAILPIPLADHDKGTIDYELFEADKRDDHMEEIIDYLYRDCTSLFGVVSDYVDAYGANLTLASGALKFWSNQRGEKPPETNQTFYDFFKPFYYGGRVECFEKGLIDEPFKVADINSAYPFAMLSNHPFGTRYSESDELPIGDYETAKAFIHMRAESHGALPFRGESLEFPNDGEIREFFITGHEFIAARDTGRLVLDDVIAVYQFIEEINFAPYVNHFYEMKKLATKGSSEYILAKLHLNSLYGKFGANPANYQEFKTCAPEDVYAMHEIHGYDFADYFGEHAIICRPISEAAMRYYNVAVAASITGFVRAYLWRAISQCKGVMYCDTDSIAARETGSLLLGDELGQWDIEADCINGGIAGKKLYAFNTGKDYKTASKGVRLTAQEILQVCAGNVVKYANPVPSFSLKNGIKFIDREVRLT